MVSLDEARRIFFSALTKSIDRVETVPLGEALGRVTARDCVSQVQIPDFRRSGMDGYAVQAADLTGTTPDNPRTLKLVGEVAMGDRANFAIRSGEAAYVTTGGWVPDGADAVIMVELTRPISDRNEVEIFSSIEAGKNIMNPGDDVEVGELVLPAGRVIRPEDISALAGIGLLHVDVYARPKVYILTTGDELVPADQKPLPGQVRDSNSWGLAAAITLDGGVPTVRTQIPDEEDEYRAILHQALGESDMIIISGGSSMGKRDYTPDLISEVAELLVYGIEIKPGKPTVLAVTDEGKPIIGLPGNPVPALLIYGLFGRQALQVRRGIRHILPPASIKAVLRHDWRTPKVRDEFVRVTLVRDEEGTIWADPVPGLSGYVTHLTHADGLFFAVRDQVVQAGTIIDVYPFYGSAMEGPAVG